MYCCISQTDPYSENFMCIDQTIDGVCDTNANCATGLICSGTSATAPGTCSPAPPPSPPPPSPPSNLPREADCTDLGANVCASGLCEEFGPAHSFQCCPDYATTDTQYCTNLRESDPCLVSLQCQTNYCLNNFCRNRPPPPPPATINQPCYYPTIDHNCLSPYVCSNIGSFGMYCCISTTDPYSPPMHCQQQRNGDVCNSDANCATGLACSGTSATTPGTCVPRPPSPPPPPQPPGTLPAQSDCTGLGSGACASGLCEEFGPSNYQYQCCPTYGSTDGTYCTNLQVNDPCYQHYQCQTNYCNSNVCSNRPPPPPPPPGGIGDSCTYPQAYVSTCNSGLFCGGTSTSTPMSQYICCAHGGTYDGYYNAPVCNPSPPPPHSHSPHSHSPHSHSPHSHSPHSHSPHSHSPCVAANGGCGAYQNPCCSGLECHFVSQYGGYCGTPHSHTPHSHSPHSHSPHSHNPHSHNPQTLWTECRQAYWGWHGNAVCADYFGASSDGYVGGGDCCSNSCGACDCGSIGGTWYSAKYRCSVNCVTSTYC